MNSYNSIAQKLLITRLKKWANCLSRHFFKEYIHMPIYTYGQQVYEKLLNVTNHYENANLNHNEISFHTGYYQKSKSQQCW